MEAGYSASHDRSHCEENRSQSLYYVDPVISAFARLVDSFPRVAAFHWEARTCRGLIRIAVAEALVPWLADVSV